MQPAYTRFDSMTPHVGCIFMRMHMCVCICHASLRARHRASDNSGPIGCAAERSLSTCGERSSKRLVVLEAKMLMHEMASVSPENLAMMSRHPGWDRLVMLSIFGRASLRTKSKCSSTAMDATKMYHSCKSCREEGLIHALRVPMVTVAAKTRTWAC